MEKVETKNGIKKVDFARIQLFILTNRLGMEAAITNYGGKVVSLHIPTGDKEFVDVVLGHKSIDEYLKSDQIYFGALIGRVGNRIANGKFSLDGEKFELIKNNGPNSLHGGPKGFFAVVWNAKQLDNRTLELTFASPDGDQGYPGELVTVVTYQLAENSNTLRIHYTAVTDKKTIVNLTHHSFFNLSGADSGYIGDDHILTINATEYTPTDETKIPTGKLAPVAGTPFDFTTPHAIGERIAAKNHPQLVIGNGYDHNYVLQRPKDAGAETLVFAARVFSLKTGITMDVYTTEPGLQFYSGNNVSTKVIGKTGKPYSPRCAFCLETQHFPDAINHPNFASVVLSPGETYSSCTEYRFSVED